MESKVSRTAMPYNDSMRVSLVMPTLNGGELLERVLDGIDRQPGAMDLERIAIDSGSSDDTVERLAAHGFTVHGIDQREFNHGDPRAVAHERPRPANCGHSTSPIMVV